MILIKFFVFYITIGFISYLISKPFIHKKQTKFSQSLFYTIGFVFRPCIIAAVSIETWDLNRKAMKMIEKKHGKLTKEEREALMEIINKIR